MAEQSSQAAAGSTTWEAGISAAGSGALVKADLWKPEKSEQVFQIDQDQEHDESADASPKGKDELHGTAGNEGSGYFEGEAADECDDYWDAS